MAFTEQEVLAGILKSQDEGGAALADGSLSEGADVPAVLDENPATRQLLEEAIATQSGDSAGAVASSQEFNAGSTTATTPDPTTSTNGVTTSADADAAFNDSVSTLDTLSAGAGTGGTGDITAPDLTDAEGIFGEQDLQIGLARNLNQEQLADQITNIAGAFAARRSDQQKSNANRLGGTRNLLAATGASTFASGQSAITGEIQRGNDALAELSALEQQAIRAAKAAAAGQDLALLQKSINNAEAARQAKNEVRQQTFENLLALRTDDRAESSSRRSEAAATLNSIGTLSPEAIRGLDPAALTALESSAGLPSGFMDAFVQTQEGVAAAASQEALFERSTELLDMALKLPAGTEFQVGDFTITGLDIGDRKVFESKDASGNVTFTTVDPATGAVLNVATVPGIGTATTSGISGGGSSSGGGGGSSSAISSNVASLIAQGTALIGTTDQATGQIITSQDVFRGLLQYPEVAGDPSVQGQITDAFQTLDSFGPEYKYIETTSGDTSVIVPFNPSTGTIGDTLIPTLPQEEDGGGGGLISDFIGGIGSFFGSR